MKETGTFFKGTFKRQCCTKNGTFFLRVVQKFCVQTTMLSNDSRSHGSAKTSMALFTAGINMPFVQSDHK